MHYSEYAQFSRNGNERVFEMLISSHLEGVTPENRYKDMLSDVTQKSKRASVPAVIPLGPQYSELQENQ